MRIILIYPPTTNIITTTIPKKINQERGFNPPLGLLYIASYLKKNSSHEVYILDAEAERLNDNELHKRIGKINPDLVGIQVLTFTLIDVLKTISIIKNYSREIPVVLGGPHVTLFPYESLAFDDVDYIVMGEGEFAFARLVDNLDNPEELKNIPGVGFKQNGNLSINANVEIISNLDVLPFPDRRMLPYKKYYSLLSKSFPITTMMSSRGCPYRCIYCERLGKKFRAVSAEKVVTEIEDCLSLGIKEIFFHDDTFTVDKQRVIRICSEIKKRNLQFSWDARARIDTVDYNLLKIMKKGGCTRISFGVESGNTEILRILRKDIDLKKTEEVFSVCRELGIETLADFMIGSPGETRVHIKDTIRFAKKLKPDYVQFSVTTPYPGTELYRMALSQGIISKDVWKEFAQCPSVNFVPPLWTEHLSRNELLQLLDFSYRQFYLSFWFIFKEICKIKSLKEFIVKFKAALQILKRG